MVFSQLVAQANRSAPTQMPDLADAIGTPGISPAQVIPVGTTRVTYRLTSSNWNTGSGDFLEWAMDRNDLDGNGWKEITDGITPEGAVGSKDGAMPMIIYEPGGQDSNGVRPLDHEIELRVRYRMQGTLRFGLEWERLS